ncbi:hypothetical protein PDESU_00540 [Pontiella desulfatans]|uniref:Uncharacterized protein n=2 Tax=Pontiella desulfatans TaxID=2750659 RepID=A0A6C2TWS1_PONDE|nr:hypothetical protein PDESU_00540 [Pontiella desulfatans]
MPEAETSDMMLARKTFDLSEVPGNASLSITAGSRYELFVNGNSVAQGPARCAPHDQSYDVHALSHVLQVGKNVIAVRVHHQRDTVSYYNATRGGLLAQLDGLEVQTDSSWRVSADNSWNRSSPVMARFHYEVCDDVDLRNIPNDWNTAEFDDSGWETARVLQRETGWPSPQANEQPGHLIPPWTSLEERELPYLKTRIVDGGTPLAEPVPVPSAKGRPVKVYDLGEVCYGNPMLELRAKAGTEVEVICAPYLLDGKIKSPIAASRYIDRIICSGERDQWTAFYAKPVRWLAVVGDVEVHYAGVRCADYPFEEQGTFQCPEKPELEAIWKASAKTVKVCTSDAYTDNYRERRQYAQTAWYACLGNYAVFGDTALQRRYLVQIAQEQLPNGIMPAYAPYHGGDFMVILDSNCFWIRGLHQYLLYSGDDQTVRDLLPAARRLMGLLSSYSHESELIESPPYPYWLDHAVQDRRGANFCLNAHYLGAVEDFAQVLNWLAEPDAGLYTDRAVQMREGLKEFWDAERQAFADASINGERSTLFSEHADAMALAMKIATPEQSVAVASRILQAGKSDFVKHTDGTTMVTPAMSYFLHTGLCEAGKTVESMALLQERFKHMLEPGTNGTLWEEWWLDATGRSGTLRPFPAGRSDAQTESAFPPALFVRYLLGIEPVAPGMRKVLIHPVPAGLNCKGAIPTPSGLLEVEWNGSEVTVSAPHGIDVQLAPECPEGTILN